jgi:hypothetical protein
MSSESAPSGKHAIMWELIPWLVNGRLNGEEGAAVKAHIESCAECRGEYAQQLRIFDAMQADQSIAFASEASFQKLAARLDAAPIRPHTQYTVHWLAAASVIAALGLAAWGGWMLRAPAGAAAPAYSTLTAPPAAAGGARLRVVFTSTLTLSELTRLLHSIDARISDGPTEAGVFTLALAPGRSSAAEVAQRLAALRADANVRFAEPVFAPP